MAVTQQFARIPATQLVACRQSVPALDALCSFTSTPDEDYLDLNWWPIILRRAWELTGASARALAVLQRGFGGDKEVNPAYRDHPNTIWEHPVTALEPPQVGEVAEALRAVMLEAIHAVVPSNPDQIEAKLGKLARDIKGDLAEQLAQQHTILRDPVVGWQIEAFRKSDELLAWSADLPFGTSYHALETLLGMDDLSMPEGYPVTLEQVRVVLDNFDVPANSVGLLDDVKYTYFLSAFADTRTG